MSNTNITASIDRLKGGHTETEKIILSRRSVRQYKKEQVPEFMVRRILEAGRFAPSAGNYQPWKFIVLRDPDIIDGITETVISSCRTFSKMLDYRRKGFSWLRPLTKIFTRLMHHELHPMPFGAIPLVADGKLGLWHGAPTVIIILKDVRGVSSPELDCGIAGQNMVLAAHSMGLGTCWVGFSKLALDKNTKWKKLLGISYPYRFMSSLAIGWPRGNPDGMITRQTGAVDWYENGTMKTVSHQEEPSEGKFGLLDRFRIPTYNDPAQMRFGIVEIDREKCTGCALCAGACPSKTIDIIDRKARPRTGRENECAFCGDCVAICAAGAITMKSPYRFTKFYKTINRAGMSPPRL
jgi:nitroreductase/NAD-dependent dihydropyrimidine dehydrogenase PreA subunit